LGWTVERVDNTWASLSWLSGPCVVLGRLRSRSATSSFSACRKDPRGDTSTLPPPNLLSPWQRHNNYGNADIWESRLRLRRGDTLGTTAFHRRKPALCPPSATVPAHRWSALQKATIVPVFLEGHDVVVAASLFVKPMSAPFLRIDMIVSEFELIKWKACKLEL